MLHVFSYSIIVLKASVVVRPLFLGRAIAHEHLVRLSITVKINLYFYCILLMMFLVQPSFL